MKRRAILFAISFGLLAALIYFSNPGKVFSTLLEADPIFILMAVGVWFVGCILRSYRWHFLLKETGIDIPFTTTVKYYITGMFISNLSPAKSGEPAKAAFLKKFKGQSFSKGVSSIFTGRGFDILAMVILAMVGLFLLPPASELLRWVYIAVFVYLSAIIFAIYLVFSGEKMERILGKLVSIFSFLPAVERLEDRVETFVEKFRDSLSGYKNMKTASITIFLSVIIWIVTSLKTLLLFLSLGMNTPFLVIITVTCTGTLIGALTFLPGSLGSGEIIFVTLFSMFLPFAVSELTTVAILSRIVGFWIYAVVGALLLSTFDKEALDLDFL